MHTSKLVDTLKCLTSDEIIRLEKFLSSPYFLDNEPGEPCLTLFRYLARFHPDFEHPELAREVAYHKLFPGETTMAKSRLEKRMTLLFKEIKRFIAIEMHQQETREEENDLLMARFFRNRNNLPEYERMVDKLRDRMERYAVKDVAYFKRLYQLEEEYCSYKSWFNTRKTDLNLSPAIQALDIYFLLTRMEYVVLYLSQLRTVPVHLDHHLIFMEDIEPLLQKPPFNTIPLLQIYYLAYQLLVQERGNRDIFLEFNTLLQEYEHVLPDEKVKDFQAMARNYCIREFNSGNEVFFKIAFDLYKLHLEKGYLYRNGLLHAVVVKNLVSMGLRMHELDWVLAFIQSHRERITGISNPDEAYRFNLAMYHFHVRDYQRAHEFLDHAYDDLFYKLAAKRLEIKTLYETESPILDSRIEAFHIFMFRMSGGQLAEVYVESNKQFIAFLRRIMKPTAYKNAKRIQKIKTDLIHAPTVVERDWLLEILERL